MSLDYEVYKEGGVLNDRYIKIDDLSEGSYGFVSLAKDLNEKKLVAIKYIFKYTKDNNEKISSDYEDALYEINIHSKIGKHPNIVQLLDSFDSYIVLEYCTNGDLYEAIKDDIISKKTNDITHILNQIINAIEFVHSKSIFHRDIKPENILITGMNWDIKLTDWGLATINETSTNRSVGSERYMAPELFETNLDINERKKPYLCSAIDLWSMGIVFLNIVFSKNPFTVANQSDKSFCYFASNREALFDIFSTMSLDFFQLLRHCLTIDPSNRNLSKMKLELTNLSSYTLDDDYYNNDFNDFDDYLSSQNNTSITTANTTTTDTTIDINNKLKDHLTVNPKSQIIIPPSSAPTKQFITNINKLTPSEPTNTNNSNNTTNDSKLIDNKNTIIQSSNKENEIDSTRSQSLPKYKVPKHSHNNDHNNKNYQRKHSNKYTNNKKPIKIKQKQSNYYQHPKFVKNSRMPLGIPTPNTHINNFFAENYHNNNYNNHNNNNNFSSSSHSKNNNHYGSSSSSKHYNNYNNNFNTKNFFTPPSVHNRYMEGIFKGKYNNNNNNNNYKQNFFHKNFNNKNNNYTTQTATRRQSIPLSAFSNNYDNTHNNKYSSYYSKQQQFSQTLPTNNNLNKKSRASSFSNHNGKYIPPKLRSIHNQSPLQGVSANTNVNSHSNSDHSADDDDVFQIDKFDDVDDDDDDDEPLFTLDENDSDFNFIQDSLNDLSLDSKNFGNSSRSQQHHHSMKNFNLSAGTSPSHIINPHSPSPSQSPLQHLNNNINVGMHINSSSLSNSTHNNHNHNRLPDLLKSPINGNHQGLFSSSPIQNPFISTLSPSSQNNQHNNNTIEDDEEYKTKPGIYVPPHHRKLSIDPPEILINSNANLFKPIIGVTANIATNNNTSYSKSTTAVESNNVFADSNNNEKIHDSKYYNRRSSILQDQAIDSLEQYKSNWMVLNNDQD